MGWINTYTNTTSYLEKINFLLNQTQRDLLFLVEHYISKWILLGNIFYQILQYLNCYQFFKIVREWSKVLKPRGKDYGEFLYSVYPLLNVV